MATSISWLIEMVMIAEKVGGTSRSDYPSVNFIVAT